MRASLQLLASAGRPGWPGLTLSGDDLQAATEVCERLDNLPLALELAAARLTVLTPVQLRDRLADPLELLQRPGRNVLERHRSLRATIDWTLGLLHPASRSLFTCLGVFAASASLADMESVLAASGTNVVDALDELMEFALVRRVEEGDGIVRFQQPEALKEVSDHELRTSPEADRWRRAHAQHILAVIFPARLLTLCTTAVHAAAVHLNADTARAYRWARRNDPGLGTALAAAWSLRLAFEGHLREADPLIAHVLNSTEVAAEVRAQALFARGVAQMSRGELAQALALADEAVRLAEPSDSDLLTAFLAGRGGLRAFMGDLAGGIHDTTRASQRAREMGEAALAGTLFFEAQVQIMAGHLGLAEELSRSAAELGRLSGAWAISGLATQSGDLALAAARPGEALGHYGRSLADAEARQDDGQVVFDLCSMSQCLMMLDHHADALELLGLAEAHAGQAYGTPAFTMHAVGAEQIQTSVAAVGQTAADRQRAAGRAVPPAERGNRARELARQFTVDVHPTTGPNPA